MSNRSGLRRLRGMLPDCAEIDELHDAGADDELNAVFDEQLADAFDDADEDGLLEDDAPTARVANALAVRQAIETQSLLEREKRSLGFTLPVRFDVVDTKPIADDDAWIYDRAQSELAFTEDAIVHRHLRNHVDRRPAVAKPVPMGCGRVTEVPNDLTELRFTPTSLLYTPCLETANTVVTFVLNSPLNLTKLARRVVSVGYNPRRFAAASMRLGNGRTALFFSRGSVVCTGAKGELLSVSACLEFIYALQRLLLRPIELRNYRMQNVVSNGAAGFPINLPLLEARYPMNAQYKRLRFPGLVFRLNCRQRVFIIFASGQCIVTGFKSRFESCLAWRWLHSVLWEFKLAAGDDGDTDAEFRRKTIEDASVVADTCRRIARVYESALSERVSHGDSSLSPATTSTSTADIDNEDEPFLGADAIATELMRPETHAETECLALDDEAATVASWFASD